MKEFDLDAALNGEPVKLRNGNKAFICYKLSDDYKYWDGSPINFNICGYILNFNGDIAMLNTAWTTGGKWTIDEIKSDRDIIGMWEEPKISIEDLPKPFHPEIGDEFFYLSVGTVQYCSFYSDINADLMRNGQCFSTREDAQKWLYFMKSMME